MSAAIKRLFGNKYIRKHLMELYIFASRLLFGCGYNYFGLVMMILRKYKLRLFCYQLAFDLNITDTQWLCRANTNYPSSLQLLGGYDRIRFNHRF